MPTRSLYIPNGSSVELNNCLEEARIATAHRNSDARSVANRAVADGLFVAVCFTTAYCRSTDAICGEHLSVLGAYEKRAAAEARIFDAGANAVLYGDSDERFEVWPKLPVQPLVPLVVDDGIPF